MSRLTRALFKVGIVVVAAVSTITAPAGAHYAALSAKHWERVTPIGNMNKLHIRNQISWDPKWIYRLEQAISRIEPHVPFDIVLVTGGDPMCQRQDWPRLDREAWTIPVCLVPWEWIGYETDGVYGIPRKYVGGPEVWAHPAQKVQKNGFLWLNSSFPSGATDWRIVYTLAHELGHSVGLGHTDNCWSVMSYCWKTTNLNNSDKDLLRAIYHGSSWGW